MSDKLREALDRLPRLRITGEQLDAIDPDPEKVFYTDWDEWDEYVRLDAVRAALSEEAAVPLDVERLERVLRYIHGNSVPFPVRRRPEEYAAFIVECDARLTADTPSSDTPERPA